MSSQNSLAYITDTHLDESFLHAMGVNSRENWNCILENVSERGLQNIVFGGDIGKATAHSWFFDSLNDFSFKLTLGNHDNYSDVTEYLHPSTPKKNKQELFYSHDAGNYTFLFLDSSSNIISNHQLKWLDRELESKQRIVIFIHHPILPVNTFVDAMSPLENRNEVEETILQSGQEVTIFCGHYHLDHTQNKGPITQIITPAGSYQMEKSPTKIINTDVFGYRIIRFKQQSIDTELVMF